MAKRISVKGEIQDLGFGLFVHGLASRLDLHGWIRDTTDGVEILIDGQNDCMEEFIRRLASEKPSLARIDSVQLDEAPPDISSSFEVRDSEPRADALSLTDIALCRDCERELFNPKASRYLYPFISCRHCGPRFTILRDLPYNRPNTTMANFPLCDNCGQEYMDPHNRRFQAHQIACPECGPFVELRETHSQFPTSIPRVSSIEFRVSAVLKARRLLREGYTVAIKGLGGFQLVCDASNPYTLAELRDRKGHSDKPFVLMAADLSAIASICQILPEEQSLLTGEQKPIVLLTKKKITGSLSYRVSELVAPNLDSLGVMLPYTPLHHLLLNQTDPVLAREPVPPILVLTSGNFHEEPIAIDNKDALERLSAFADAFLLHNRDIMMRADDSVVRVNEGKPIFLRRSRGYAPYSVELPYAVPPTLALGSKSKNAFCLARGRSAFLSPHIGALENMETRDAFEKGVEHLSRLFRIHPEIIVHDLDPHSFATYYRADSEISRVAVQHHHAHIASCMADNGLEDGQVIGLCFDGHGYGTDGAWWGGEVLLASYLGYERLAHLEYLPLPENELTPYSPWRIAVAYAHALGIRVDDLPFLQNVDKRELRTLRLQVVGKTKFPLTSSIGRLFDAAASLMGIRNKVTYEAQAPMEMEVLARHSLPTSKSYPFVLEQTDTGLVIRVKEVFLGMIRDLQAGEPVGTISACFHKTVAAIAVEVCRQARESTGQNRVAMSGGVWQNQILLNLVRDGLQKEGFAVYSHRQIATNDSGLALGQAVIANFQVRNPRTCLAQENRLKR